MEGSTYISRLESFKKGYVDGAKQKWDARGPSMVSLARAFFRFVPARGAKDQVECVNCSLKLSGWANYRGNPIQRHAGLQTQCFVSQLGDLCAALTKGQTVSAESIYNSCAASFRNPRELLASKGFIHIPFSEEQPHTLGCIQCLCFPQNCDDPQHKKSCPIPRSISRLTIEKSTALLQEKPAEIQEAVPEGEPSQVLSDNSIMAMLLDPKQAQLQKTVVEKLLPHLTSLEEQKEESSETKCKSLFEAAKCDIKNEILKHAALYESGQSNEILVLEALETAVIEHLETTHARRIALICSETERVATKLIEEGTHMLKIK